MMRHYLTWVLVLAGWIFGGFYLGNKICCGGAAAALNSGFKITDGAKTIAASSAGNLIFGLSGATPTFEPSSVKNEFNALATYLKENPSRSVTLNGHYMANEKNNTSFDNLGFARADALKGYLIGLGVPASQLMTGSVLKGNIDSKDNKVYGAMDYVFGTAAIGGKTITIQDGAKFNATEADNLAFAVSSFEHNKPVSEKLQGVFNKTATYLKENPNRSLKITGLYTDKETNNSVLPNLGMARANDIKSMLVDLGVPSKQVEIDSRMANTLNFNADEEVFGPANYAFFDAAASNNKLAKVEANLNAKPLTLYFQTGAQSITLSNEQRQYLADLMYYLDNKEGGAVNITGHTDNKGAINMNKRLSRKRAEFVKDYLGKNGINTKRVSTIGMGPDQPVADNGTAEGRAKNRRVEVTIK